MARIGKIARLPRDIRSQLNTRLQDGAEGKQIVLWLNSLPEVRKILAERFDGRPISEQNLSDWRQGGFEEWLAYQDLQELINNPPQKKTPVQAAAEMLEEIDACLAKSESKDQAFQPRKKARRRSRKPARRRPAPVHRAPRTVHPVQHVHPVHPAKPVHPDDVAAVYDRRRFPVHPAEPAQPDDKARPAPAPAAQYDPPPLAPDSAMSVTTPPAGADPAIKPNQP